MLLPLCPNYGFAKVLVAVMTSDQICNIAQKITFSIKDFFSKCDHICSFVRMFSETEQL